MCCTGGHPENALKFSWVMTDTMTGEKRVSFSSSISGEQWHSGVMNLRGESLLPSFSVHGLY
jgi:hypothetical protein